MARRFRPCIFALGAAALLARSASAQESPEPSELPGPFVLHAAGAAAHTAGQGKIEQFGWAAGGIVAGELRLTPMLGLELPVGALLFADGAGHEQGIADTGSGTLLFATPGVRLHPLRGAANEAGVWLAGGAGAGITGNVIRATTFAHVGYDVDLGRFQAGPYVGYAQVVQPEGELRPEDARLVLFGVHLGLGGAAGAPRAVRSEEPRPRDDDADGLVDALDACPRLAEDRDGIEDADGCPDLDDDHDGVLDAADRCPREGEDADGFQDEDGCPDRDNDGDGLGDWRDRCPLEPETPNGYADGDGCPDVASVRVVQDRIEVDEHIRFELDSAAVSVKSWPMLERIARLLVEHPEYELVDIRGYTDDTGSAEYNVALSGARARAVGAMLVRYGVAATRLSYDARGETDPQSYGCDQEARQQNRRVEMTIIRRHQATANEEPSVSRLAATVTNQGGEP